MKNPWTKKNPFMSMWLSGANTMASSARALAAAEGKRQATTMRKQGAKQVADFWTAALTPAAAPKKRRRK